MTENVVWLNDVNISDVEKVGGKNASLGEMISGLSSQGIQVPGGFATTAEAFESFLNHSNLRHQINELLLSLDITNIEDLKKQVQLFANGLKWLLFQKNFTNLLLTVIKL